MLDTSEYRTEIVKDVDISVYTGYTGRWISKFYDDYPVRIYKNLAIDGDLNLDDLGAGYAALIIEDNLTVNGDIQNYHSDIGITLCVAGHTTANNLIAGGSSVLLNTAYIKNFTVGHYNDGILDILRLKTQAMLNFNHYTHVKNTDDIEISLGREDYAINGKFVLYTKELLLFWQDHNLLTDSIEINEDYDDEDDDDEKYILDDDILLQKIANKEEASILYALQKSAQSGEIENHRIKIQQPDTKEEIDTAKTSTPTEAEDDSPDKITIGRASELGALGESIERGELSNLIGLEFLGIEVDRIPESVKSLTQIEKLRISECKMDAFPRWIRHYTQLKSLYFTDNAITTLPDWIGALTQLKDLCLVGNNLTQLPKTISQLTKLESLTLGGNELNSIPSSLSTLKKLTKLEFTANRFKELPEFIGHLDSLQELSVMQNKISTLPEWIGNLTSLDTLYIGLNNISELPKSMGNLVNLEWLVIFNNQLTTLPSTLANLTNLKDFHIENNYLTEIPTWIQQLESLEEFNIEFNRIDHIPDWLTEMEELSLFSLRGNTFTDIPESVIEEFDLEDGAIQTKKEIMDELKSLDEAGDLDLTDLSLEEEYGYCLTEFLNLKKI